MLLDRLDSNLTGHDRFWTEAHEGSLLALRHAARFRGLATAVLGPPLFIAVVGHRLSIAFRREPCSGDAVMRQAGNPARLGTRRRRVAGLFPVIARVG